MPARLLSLFVLALVGLARAAPAPQPARSRGPEQAPVELMGWVKGGGPQAGGPCVIAAPADWEAFAAAVGLKSPPRVNFRTHFLLVHVHVDHGQLNCEIDADGDLRRVPAKVAATDRFRLDVGLVRREAPRTAFYVRSFPRSAVKTVNGLPLPKR